MGAVDLKSMEGTSQIRPANGWRSRAVHGVEREGECTEGERESERVGAGWVEGMCSHSIRRTGWLGKAGWPARGGDRRSSVTEQMKQSRLGPSAVPKRTVR